MRGLHVRFEGFTAYYPYPFLRTGTFVNLPLPPYSSILGMISACLGEYIKPEGIQVGFEFRNHGKSIDIERTQRLKTNRNGNLETHESQGISYREFYFHPKLDVYINQIDLLSAFENPVATPRFGRSQDIAWISMVKVIELDSVQEGVVSATLIPYPLYETAGIVLPPLVDYYTNDVQQRTRLPGRISRYQALPDFPPPMEGMLLQSKGKFQLFHPRDSKSIHHAVFMQDF